MNMRSQAGFSIVEAVVVGVVAAALATLAIPQIQQSMALYRLSSSANLVASELNAGRALAISRNWIYEAELNTTDSTIQVIDSSNSTNNPRIPQFLEPGITFSSVPSPTIRFFSRGHARGGTIQLQNQSGNTIQINVSASGKVEIQPMT